MTAADPLVSIAIPTYNRADSVERAARSALAQDHGNVEVVVSDDGSTDDTEARMRALAAADGRLRYVRHVPNAGHAENFNRALEAATGSYFMWLADDDWLEAGYVSGCLAALREDPGLISACGRGRYYRGDDMVVQERAMNLLARRPGQRVLRYYAQVTLNGVLYGVARRADVARHGFPRVLGGDWLLMAALACRGRIRTLEDVHIHRSIAGISDPDEGSARLVGGEFGVAGLRARFPHVVNAAIAYRTIAHDDATFAALGAGRRKLIGAACGALVVLRYVPVIEARAMLKRVGALDLARTLIDPLRRGRHE
jgi:glycosyltransferase involved in cell wall biosynthesis